MNISRRQAVRTIVRRLEPGEEVTARDLRRRLSDKYPKMGFTSTSVGSLVHKYCSDLVTISRTRNRGAAIYTRREASDEQADL